VPSGAFVAPGTPLYGVPAVAQPTSAGAFFAAGGPSTPPAALPGHASAIDSRRKSLSAAWRYAPLDANAVAGATPKPSGRAEAVKAAPDEVKKAAS
jgi:hypothetical protein